MEKEGKVEGIRRESSGWKNFIDVYWKDEEGTSTPLQSLGYILTLNYFYYIEQKLLFTGNQRFSWQFLVKIRKKIDKNMKNRWKENFCWLIGKINLQIELEFVEILRGMRGFFHFEWKFEFFFLFASSPVSGKMYCKCGVKCKTGKSLDVVVRDTS